jgi:hypothetical protein
LGEKVESPLLDFLAVSLSGLMAFELSEHAHFEASFEDLEHVDDEDDLLNEGDERTYVRIAGFKLQGAASNWAGITASCGGRSRYGPQVSEVPKTAISGTLLASGPRGRAGRRGGDTKGGAPETRPHLYLLSSALPVLPMSGSGQQQGDNVVRLLSWSPGGVTGRRSCRLLAPRASRMTPRRAVDHDGPEPCAS